MARTFQESSTLGGTGALGAASTLADQASTRSSTDPAHQGVSQAQLERIFDTISGTFYLPFLLECPPAAISQIYEYGKKYQDAASEVKCKIAKSILDEMEGSLPTESAQATRCQEARMLARLESRKWYVKHFYP